MIVDRLDMTGVAFHRLTGWEIKPEGACKDDRCVPLSPPVRDAAGPIDVAAVTERIGMPIAHDETHGLWAIGPESGGRVLDSARMPERRASRLQRPAVRRRNPARAQGLVARVGVLVRMPI